MTASEIDCLLDAVDDIKYKAMFAVMYSSGMRVSEVIHLHYDDISRSNMQDISIEKTDGRIVKIQSCGFQSFLFFRKQKNPDILTGKFFGILLCMKNI